MLIGNRLSPTQQANQRSNMFVYCLYAAVGIGQPRKAFGSLATDQLELKFEKPLNFLNRLDYVRFRHDRRATILLASRAIDLTKEVDDHAPYRTRLFDQNLLIGIRLLKVRKDLCSWCLLQEHYNAVPQFDEAGALQLFMHFRFEQPI